MTDEEIRSRLALIYEEVMWVADRPHVTAASARSWYTHVRAVALTVHIRRFTGKVSKSAIANFEGALRLEHFKRIQTNLTALVDRHHSEGINDPEEFIDKVLDSEQVHIVTMAENYAIMRAGGDYAVAGVELTNWRDLTPEIKEFLWRQLLRGKVSNAVDYNPQQPG